MSKSKHQGHDIEYLNDKWVFSDTKKPILENSDRPCKNCGKKSTKEGHDSCLGKMSGVINACCGHGNEKEAYIQFVDGKIIRGKDAIEIQKSK
ncbi:MAG: hypothetical protein CVU95_08440 [Firmicutes bacterium HGW-Firmicutes-2]|jgi:hypothetical protein|nr:MAG: hypothetical protein CVU95_08440 [Firmicutes bacterium HGW-Firmicutes-2]